MLLQLKFAHFPEPANFMHNVSSLSRRDFIDYF